MTDVRGIGFAERAPFASALAWVEAHTAALSAEAGVPTVGRVLARAVESPADWPARDRAAIDGHAVRAEATEGAGDYNPLPLDATAIASGAAMPDGTDAVLPFALLQGGAAVGPVARADGVERRGSGLRAGGVAVAAGPLRPQDVALLMVLGLDRVELVRRTRVGLVVAGARGGPDVLSPLLTALVGRDGGVAQSVAWPAQDADLVLVVGRTGAGLDDDAALNLVEAGGTVDLHGIAMAPGGSAGCGRIGAVPVLLLPGAPHDAFAAYDLLAAPAIRRRAGLPEQPYGLVERRLDRKIVSAVGLTELVPVRFDGTAATPLGPAASLADLVRADGFVLVPDGSEGFAAGTMVPIRAYRA